MITLTRRARRDDGVAMITVVLLSAVVVLLGVVAVRLASHDATQSAQNRERVQGIAAAEAGINDYLAQLEDAQAQVSCEGNDALTIDPGSKYEFVAEFTRPGDTTYEDPAGIPVDMCDSNGQVTVDPDEPPTQVQITSVGTAVGDNPKRTMEALVGLALRTDVPLGPNAIFSQQSPVITTKTTVKPSLAGGIDADVYTNGDLLLSTPFAASHIHGNLLVNGSVTFGSGGGSFHVHGDLIARDGISMQQGRVHGSAVASTGSISISHPAEIIGNARAATTIDDPNDRIGGKPFPGSPTTPPEPEAQSFPPFPYDSGTWAGEDFQIYNTSDCSDAKTKVTSGIAPGEKWVIRITSGCTFTVSPSDNLAVRGDLAIVSDGAFQMRSGSKDIASADGQEHDLFLVFGFGKATPCTDGNIEFESGGGGIDPDLHTVLHTPCEIEMRAPSSLTGQLFGGKVKIGPGNATIDFSPVPIPGTAPQGFIMNILYFREVPSS